MKTKTVATRFNEPVIARIPDDDDILNLKVGDLAPECFGKLSQVVEIFHLGKDIHGNLFCCYYTAFGGNNGRISGSMKSGELIRTVPLTAVFKSSECDALESEMQ